MKSSILDVPIFDPCPYAKFGFNLLFNEIVFSGFHWLPQHKFDNDPIIIYPGCSYKRIQCILNILLFYYYHQMHLN